MKRVKRLFNRIFGVDPAHPVEPPTIDFEAAERDKKHLHHLLTEMARTSSKMREDHDRWWGS